MYFLSQRSRRGSSCWLSEAVLGGSETFGEPQSLGQTAQNRLLHRILNLVFQLNQQWLHYTMGDFSRSGFVGDPLYPTQDMGTSLTSNYTRPKQNKQELLCGNVRAEENSTLVDVDVEPPPHPGPIFTYSLPGRTTTQVIITVDPLMQIRRLHQT